MHAVQDFRSSEFKNLYLQHAGLCWTGLQVASGLCWLILMKYGSLPPTRASCSDAAVSVLPSDSHLQHSRCCE